MSQHRAAVSISEPFQPLMAHLAKAVAIGGGESGGALRVAQQLGMPERVQKALQPGMTTGDTDMGGLKDSLTILTSFIPYMRNTSLFFKLLDGLMFKLPLRTRGSFLTGSASMSVVNEAEAIGVSRLASDKVMIDPHRATGILIFSKEFLGWLAVAGDAFISAELRRAIAASVDRGLVSLIEDGDTPHRASVGASAEAALSDIKFLLDSVALTADSRPLFALAPDVARRAGTLFDGNGGGFIFPNCGPMGGEILRIPAIVCDAIDAGRIALFDGMGIAGDAEGIEILSARHATVQLESAPDSPPTGATNLFNLWQNDMVGLMPRVYFGAQRMRDNAYAYVSNVAWGSGDSPA